MSSQLNPVGQTAGITLGRAHEIELGEGAPPTESERKDYDAAMARIKDSRWWQCSEEFAKDWEMAKPIYEAAPPHEKRQLGNMTAKEVLAFHARKLTASKSSSQVPPSGGRSRPSARAPRSRSVRSSGARARSPGSRSSDDDPHELETVPPSRFRRDVAGWLEAEVR
jgi:hypothetical protein